MKILLKNYNVKTPEELIRACDGNEFLARILFNRGIDTYEKALEILDSNRYTPFNVVDFPRIDEAVDMILTSINNNEKILVYGDYDVDGVTATTVLTDGLRKLGAEVIFHVPDRFSEGYGMNIEVIRGLDKENVKLIVTCDCGISNFDEIDLAKQMGINVVLTDHHTIGANLPNADVVVNPKLLEEGHKARNISGCAMAYYVVKAIYNKLGRESETDNYLDLVALSLIADVVPLIEESRYLLKKGLPYLYNSERIGMRALLEQIGKPIENTEDVAFQIAPRINAAGRMDSATIPIEMFLSDDIEQTKEYAARIETYNTDRKNIQKEIFESAQRKAEEEKKNKKILVIFGEAWHHGVTGIVAGKICELYRKPTIILTTTEDGENVVGSARSVEDVNIYEVLSKHKEYLNKFGGHSGAAGLSLSKNNVDSFTKALEQYADIYFEEITDEKIYADINLNIKDINEGILELISKLEPYGEAFESPIFCSKDVNIISDAIKGAGHHFMIIEDKDSSHINAVKWNSGMDSFQRQHADLLYTIYKDTFNVNNEIKLKIEEISDYFDESQTQVQYIKRIGIPIEEIIAEYKNAEIFYEGPESYKPNFPTKTLETIKETEEIILYSVPRNKERLKQLIKKTNANVIIENYSYIPEYSLEQFMKMFLGNVKYLINNKEGMTTISEMSKMLNIDEDFLLVFCEYMTKKGYIEFTKAENTLVFSKESKKEVIDKRLEDTIKKYLMEKEAYIRYSLQDWERNTMSNVSWMYVPC